MPSQILLFDQSRSASHLLERIFSKQKKVKFVDGTFSECRGTQVGWLMSDSWAKGMPTETKTAFEETVEAAGRKWRRNLLDGEAEGKILFLHDHPFSTFSPELILNYINNRPPPASIKDGNFTLVPKDLLLQPGTVPILTIRDPRLAVPSAYRVLDSMGLPHGSGRPNFLISTATLWQNILYDFFQANGIEPLVVDADDIMTSRDFMRKLAERVGLDPDQCVFEWAARKEESMHPMLYKSQKFLMDSTGVDASRAGRNLDLQAEEEGWEKEFGDDVDLVREAVERAMDGYLWLSERAFRG